MMKNVEYFQGSAYQAEVPRNLLQMTTNETTMKMEIKLSYSGVKIWQKGA